MHLWSKERSTFSDTQARLSWGWLCRGLPLSLTVHSDRYSPLSTKAEKTPCRSVSVLSTASVMAWRRSPHVKYLCCFLLSCHWAPLSQGHCEAREGVGAYIFLLDSLDWRFVKLTGLHRASTLSKPTIERTWELVITFARIVKLPCNTSYYIYI